MKWASGFSSDGTADFLHGQLTRARGLVPLDGKGWITGGLFLKPVAIQGRKALGVARRKPVRKSVLKSAVVPMREGVPPKKPPSVASGRRGEGSGLVAQALAFAVFATRACFARATMAENAVASVIARSERILRSASMPAAFSPSMKRE